MASKLCVESEGGRKVLPNHLQGPSLSPVCFMLFHCWLLLAVQNFIQFLVLVLSTEGTHNQVFLRSRLVHTSCSDVLSFFF